MKTVDMSLGKIIPLPALRMVHVPALCVGTVIHDIRIEDAQLYPALLAAADEVLGKFGLLIEHRVVKDGEIITGVFNITHTPCNIRRGDVISCLVPVPVGRPELDMPLPSRSAGGSGY